MDRRTNVHLPRGLVRRNLPGDVGEVVQLARSDEEVEHRLADAVKIIVVTQLQGSFRCQGAIRNTVSQNTTRTHKKQQQILHPGSSFVQRMKKPLQGEKGRETPWSGFAAFGLT